MIIYAEPKSASHLPVIDLGPSIAGDEAARKMAADEIGVACQDTGFFYVANHGVDQALVDGAFAQSNRFFDQPGDWKSILCK